MSDLIRHECGIAVVRLKKPLEYYHDKYGTALYGFNKLFLLMEKQHNRGHDGMGIGGVKLGMSPGQPYMFRFRSAERDSLTTVFNKQVKTLSKLARQLEIDPEAPSTLRDHFEFGGQVLMGHLRYGTSGRFGEGSCHPYVRRSSWETRSLMVMGNFNMANSHELNQKLIKRGQHPVFGTDTQTVLEEIGYHIDEAHGEILRAKRGREGSADDAEIAADLDIVEVLRKAASIWDGGYTIAGAMGSGDVFAMRDARGIRPGYYFENEEIVGFASERVPLLTVFDLEIDEVKEIQPGEVVIVNAKGELRRDQFAKKEKFSPCSFERIYFSRGNDPAIYEERKRLGALLVPRIMEMIEGDLDNTIFSFIPNTAEIAYHGMMEELRKRRRDEVKKEIVKAMANGGLSGEQIDDLILKNWPRGEKIAHKDIKMRTFISQEKSRKQMVSHVYDITYDVVDSKDNLVVIDDSIVRGTTLKESIIKILAKTNPKRIIIVSTAPQIRFPDCYGIDMASIGKFIAFQAGLSVARKVKGSKIDEEIYEACLEELEKPPAEQENAVKRIFEGVSVREIERKIAEMVRPTEPAWNGELHVIFQSIEGLQEAISPNCGDWYFTGDYPTPWGYSIVNRSYVNFFRGDARRATEPELLPSVTQ